MDSLLDQTKKLAETASDGERKHLIASLHLLANSLEQPGETINRIGYLHLQTAVVRTGFHLKIFSILVDAEKSLNLDELSQATGAESALLDRLMRYLTAHGIVTEVAQGIYEANTMTKILAQPVVQAGISHCFETIGPTYQALPSFLVGTGFKNPLDAMNVPFQQAFKTDLHQFSWFTENQANLQFFNEYMALRREPTLSWLSVYPVEDEAQGWAASAPVYVNMGGGIGHQCAQFKKKFPSIPGRVVLQDLPHTIENALQTPGVEAMAHDFFQPQPVKGAKFYFFRGVLHNHPDEKVKVILQNIKSAMGPESVLLLDEFVVPDTNASMYSSALDLTMMAAFAGGERTEGQWKSILAAVGLRLEKVYRYNPVSDERVLDVRLV